VPAWAEMESRPLWRSTGAAKARWLLPMRRAVHRRDGPVGARGAAGRPRSWPVSADGAAVNVLSAISPRGRLWFRCFGGTLTAVRFVEFLRALLRDAAARSS